MQQTLRPYQIDAVQAVRAAWDKGNLSPLIALATGGGKTTIMAELLRQTIDPRRHRALVIAHTQEIVYQAEQRIRDQFGGALSGTFSGNGAMFASGLGIVMGEHNAMDARIVVATRQSLHEKRIRQVLAHGAFDTILIDECFPAGTLVDGKPIEQYRVGDPVTAYDERTGQLTTATVTHLFVKPVGVALVRIRAGGRTLVATPNHPILTQRGWVPADRLNMTDMVLVADSGKLLRASIVALEMLEPDPTVCPDGQVYNLEVNPHHTYVANGVVVHNCHHALGDNTYADIVEACREANPNVRLLGVTATPKRSDNAALGSMFEKIVYQWLITDGVRQGYLVPVTQMKVLTKVNLSSVPNAKGDYATGKLASVLEMSNWAELAVKAYMQHIHATGRSTLAFMPSVKMSEEFVRALRADGVSAEHIDGETDKARRNAILRAYAAGDVRVVSNFAVLTEGFDAPRTSAIVMGRPTRSSTLFTQMLGRGLRPFPNKLDCLLLNLTVSDAKALKTGDLIGQVQSCQKCRTDFYVGMRACPVCGFQPVKLTAKPHDPNAGASESNAFPTVGGHRGSELLTTYESVFNDAMGAWHWDTQGYMSLGLGANMGTLVIVPPALGGQFTLVRVPPDAGVPIEALAQDDALPTLVAYADRYLLEQNVTAIASKSAGWRDLPASEAQIARLSKMSAPVRASMTRGEASKLISHAVGIQRIARELRHAE